MTAMAVGTVVLAGKVLAGKVLAGKVLAAGKVLPATGVSVLTAPGVPEDEPPVGAQAARARDKITKKVPVRVTLIQLLLLHH